MACRWVTDLDECPAVYGGGCGNIPYGTFHQNDPGQSFCTSYPSLPMMKTFSAMVEVHYRTRTLQNASARSAKPEPFLRGTRGASSGYSGRSGKRDAA